MKTPPKVFCIETFVGKKSEKRMQAPKLADAQKAFSPKQGGEDKMIYEVWCQAGICQTMYSTGKKVIG